MKLRVIQPFNGYQVGQEISDPKDIQVVLNSDQVNYVVKVGGEQAAQTKESLAAKQ